MDLKKTRRYNTGTKQNKRSRNKKNKRVYKKNQRDRRRKNNYKNELEEDLRIKTVMRKIRKKPVSFKMKNKEIARKEKIDLEKEIKAEKINKAEESKV